jgi:hypothetical protein
MSAEFTENIFEHPIDNEPVFVYNGIAKKK